MASVSLSTPALPSWPQAEGSVPAGVSECHGGAEVDAHAMPQRKPKLPASSQAPEWPGLPTPPLLRPLVPDSGWPCRLPRLQLSLVRETQARWGSGRPEVRPGSAAGLCLRGWQPDLGGRSPVKMPQGTPKSPRIPGLLNPPHTEASARASLSGRPVRCRMSRAGSGRPGTPRPCEGVGRAPSLRGAPRSRGLGRGSRLHRPWTRLIPTARAREASCAHISDPGILLLGVRPEETVWSPESRARGHRSACGRLDAGPGGHAGLQSGGRARGRSNDVGRAHYGMGGGIVLTRVSAGNAAKASRSGRTQTRARARGGTRAPVSAGPGAGRSVVWAAATSALGRVRGGDQSTKPCALQLGLCPRLRDPPSRLHPAQSHFRARPLGRLSHAPSQ